MRKAAILAVSGLALAAGACTRERPDEGPRAQRAFQVGAFETVSLGGHHEVIVHVGGAPSVRAEGSERALDRLEIVVENGALQIRNRGNNWFGHHGSATVHVTVPSLSGANVGGSGGIRIDRVSGERFAAAVGGSGEILVQELRVRQADFSIGGSGEIKAAGSAERAQISVGGSGDVDLAAFEIRDAEISVAGSGDVSARATGTARISLAGSGDVAVTGPARCQVDRFGSGNVTCNGQRS